MGIKERHERDREAVRRAILDAARDLFVREGYQNVSIRKIAERIEYSPAAIYSYFPSKDDIFFALAEEGFRLLSTAEGAAGDAGGAAPLDRIRDAFWHVYEFSCRHPQYFALMFLHPDVPRISRESERFVFVWNRKQELVRLIQQAIDERALPGSVDAAAACRLLVAGVLGVGAMRLSNRLGPPAQADRIARDVLSALIAGLQAGVALESVHDVASCAGDALEPRAAAS
jgi:AcrR family transcriptional regulator